MSSVFKKKIGSFTERDREILEFIWNYKVVTTAAIHTHLFPRATISSAYRRLCRLKRSGIIGQALSLKTNNGAWELTAKGFKFLMSYLPELNEEGFKSECPDHDLLVGATLMGPWICSLPKDVEILTEQQLRRINSDVLPDWTPLTSYRRPDGYWHVFEDDRWWTLALEVETTQKSLSRYVDIIDSYQYLDNVDRVIWVLSNKSHLEILAGHIGNQSKEIQQSHNLLLQQDLERFGWSSAVQFGPEAGETLNFILSRSVLDSCRQADIHPFLDFRKFPRKPKAYRGEANP